MLLSFVVRSSPLLATNLARSDYQVDCIAHRHVHGPSMVRVILSTRIQSSEDCSVAIIKGSAVEGKTGAWTNNRRADRAVAEAEEE